jgi:hypothetical protein
MVRKPTRSAPKRRGKSKTAARKPPASRLPPVVLRTTRQSFELNTRGTVPLAQRAMQWSYIVRSRRRWSESQQDKIQQGKTAADFLRELGLTSSALEHLAQAEMVEVDIPWSDNETTGWEARILPWEYLIAGATRDLRAEKGLTITRHLRMKARPVTRSGKPRVLFVASQPDLLRGIFDFTTEEELVKTHLGVSDEQWQKLDSPTLDRLEKTVAKFQPDIVHLAGLDTHLARKQLLDQGETEAAKQLGEQSSGSKTESATLYDGYILAGSIRPVSPLALGAALTAGGNRPRLVSLNIGNSAARIAPLIVSQGAAAAVGFQDDVDDDLTELFFAVLYESIRHGLPMVDAFRTAWQRVRKTAQPGLSQGTGVVLWSAVPLVTARAAAAPPPPPRPPARLAAPVDAARVSPLRVSDHINATVQVRDEMNYSMLHNQRPLFRTFVLRCPNMRPVRGVHVKVSLFSGNELAVYEQTLEVAPPFVELKRDIQVPLTSLLIRSVHESVRTSVLVEVTWGPHVVYRNTLPVRLTPVDQWRDTEEDRKWLPSFVFPRDRAVMQLVDTAARYMRVLRDDPTAGFEGYQGVTRRRETLEEVDLQVQAIWSAIVHELRLTYINPPPGYSRDMASQRLRTPSMIVRDHSGTCVDLALFFAACLELVDIYPAVILLKAHAFPAYWRSDKFHDSFRRANPLALQTVASADAKTATAGNSQAEAWLLGPATYREIINCVNDDKLVPLETVRLTENSGFQEAAEAGRKNLVDESDFQAMIDIALARENQVTPLPILGEQS